MGELGPSEALDLFAHNSDSTVVGGVQFEDTLAVEEWAEQGFGKGEDGGCLSGSWGAVEEHVWKLFFQCVNWFLYIAVSTGGMSTYV